MPSLLLLHVGAARGLRTLPPPQALPLQLPLARNHGQMELQGRSLRTGQRTEPPGHASAEEPVEGHAAASESCLSAWHRGALATRPYHDADNAKDVAQLLTLTGLPVYHHHSVSEHAPAPGYAGEAELSL
ncbi:hypothetical protein UY3_16287 [Chelonia mydas]|uniref:Uncharacterized protein n=1 Tax=Chelonia mydas TaxID=8469 RepID=M7AUI1_CHEMY|nr:hypothetical protein UY3_16287 [Chelonia mydas]